MLNQKKQKTLDTSDLSAEVDKVSAELRKVTASLEKLVYLSEFQLKSSGVTIKYPKTRRDK